MDVIWFVFGLVLGAVVGALLGYCAACFAIIGKTSTKELERDHEPNE